MLPRPWQRRGVGKEQITLFAGQIEGTCCSVGGWVTFGELVIQVTVALDLLNIVCS